MELINFRDPGFFFLLLLLPLAFYFSSKRQSAAIRFSDISLFPKEGFSLKAAAYKMLPLLRALVLVLFVCALARPQKVSEEREYDTAGVDIMILLDDTGTMQAEDFKPINRLHVAKEEAKKFVQGRQNDRIGLVVYASQAFTQCPLTLDYDTLLWLIDEVKYGMVKDGTAIGLALATGVNRLRESPAKSKIMVLVSDGLNNMGKIDPVTGAELAKLFGIKVYTILIGKGGLVPFPIEDPLFGKRYVQADVGIDPLLMQRIADITGGQFFRADDPDGLRAAYDAIDKLEKTDIKVNKYFSYEELFYFFLIPGLFLLTIEILLRNIVLVKIP